jgi:sugar lactone lactonase YvrE
MLVVADSHAEQFVAFEVADDGTLAGWADLEHAPDSICVDADGAVWVATVPGRRCVRVREGGEVLNTVTVDRGCFVCMLGGEDGRTLFITGRATAQDAGGDERRAGLDRQLLAAPNQPAPHAGHP